MKYSDSLLKVSCLLCLSLICLMGLNCPTDKCADVTCPDGQTCNADTGECEADVPTVCETDADCATGETCNTATGECEAVPTVCETDADCETGETCNTATGECEAEPEVCETDADCATGETCNTATGECETAVTGCQTDADCPDGFCDLTSGECVTNENNYDTTYFDTDKDRVHMAPSGHASCTPCHHNADEAAGIPSAAATACDTCHDGDDPNEDSSFKSVAHGDSGCRTCHESDFETCSFCHPDAP